jgi:hypothetical protein
MIGLINLPLKVGLKTLNVSFTIILKSNQFHVKLGYPWLHSMNDISSVVHKFLNFLVGNEIFTVHRSGFNLVSSHGKFSLDLFWLEPIEYIRPHNDLFFKS